MNDDQPHQTTKQDGPQQQSTAALVPVHDMFCDAIRHHQAGRLADAERLYRQILEVAPTNVAALNNLGLLAPPAEATTLFRQALILKPDYADAHINLGAILRSQNRLDDATAHYQQALSYEPNRPEVLFSLATLFHGQGKLDEAVACYHRTLACKPDHGEALNNLALALHTQGKLAEAIVQLERLLILRPTYAEAHNNLGDVLKEQGNLDKAAESYGRALALKPDYVTVLCNLGIVFAMAGQFEPAAEWFRRTLALKPDQEVANKNLASILERDGHSAEAQIYRRRVPRPQPLVIESAPDHRRTVLILWAAGAGNVPHETLVPRRVNTRINWYVEYATDAQEDGLPPYDVVFNGIGNAELVEPSLARVTHFLSHCRRPFLNLPERVARTRRDLMPRLLADIPNVVVPPVMRLWREEAATDLAAKLAAGGLTCPLLVRPMTGQGGLGLILAETPEQLAKITFTEADADAFYFIAYHDYRNPDGYYRKYRTIFVDRRPYSYHLAISKHWLVHYFSAEMLAEPWKREEERRFLETPAIALGPAAAAAVAAIGQRMDMDYAGIDYSILADGRVLVFEANATMSVILPDAEEFPYKQSHVKAIFSAFDDMLERRGSMPSPSQG